MPGSPDDGQAMIRFAEAARRLGLRFIFDIGSQVSGLSAEEMGTSLVGAEVMLCNDYEMSIFSKARQAGPSPICCGSFRWSP